MHTHSFKVCCVIAAGAMDAAGIRSSGHVHGANTSVAKNTDHNNCLCSKPLGQHVIPMCHCATGKHLQNLGLLGPNHNTTLHCLRMCGIGWHLATRHVAPHLTPKLIGAAWSLMGGSFDH